MAEVHGSWPERWDDYLSAAIWTKRILPYVSLPSNVTPFELLFGQKIRTLASLVPLSEKTGQSGGLENVVERRKKNLR